MSAEADHCMIDIETLGTAPGSVILSIGAVMFDPLGDGLGAEFYANIDPVDAQARGLTIDASTVLWWFDQTEDARAHLRPMRLPLDHVLGGLAAFQRDHRCKRVWGHGATFDPVLLDAAYRACGLKTPWRPYDARDTRTLYELAGVKPDRAVGLHHDALDDAKAQALAVQAAMRALGKAELVKAAQAIADDYQTSDTHHPDHVLIRRSDFEAMAAEVRAMPGRILTAVAEASARNVIR